MTIKTQVTQTVEKEIELPYYYKYGSTYFKVSEEHFLQISAYDFSSGINIQPATATPIHLSSPESVQIAEDEFNEVMEQVFEKLDALRQTA